VSVYTDELMDYIRDHVKRYWGMAYRKTIGVSLITFAIVLAVGLTFTLVTQEFATASYVTYIIFWALLLLIAIFVLLSNLYTSQVSSVRLMHEDEHKVYSTRTGWLMIAIVVGVVAFLMLLFFVPPYVEAVTLLFISGGVFLILYVCIRILFKQKYNVHLWSFGDCQRTVQSSDQVLFQHLFFRNVHHGDIKLCGTCNAL
jgi:uncharacterized integral membrane protein